MLVDHHVGMRVCISGAFNASCAGGGAARQNNTIAGIGGRQGVRGRRFSGCIGAAPRTGGHSRRQSALRSASQPSDKLAASSAIRCSPASNRSVLRGYMGGVADRAGSRGEWSGEDEGRWSASCSHTRFSHSRGSDFFNRINVASRCAACAVVGGRGRSCVVGVRSWSVM